MAIQRFILEGAVRKALANMGEAERELLVFVLQKDYGIRFGSSSKAPEKYESEGSRSENVSTTEEIEEALASILGNDVGKDTAARFRSTAEQMSKYHGQNAA